MRCLLATLATASLFVAGCQSTAPTIHPDPVSEVDAGMLGALSKLAGEWEMQDENGARILAAQFAVTSGGTAVREIMFPGQPHEMTNLYHMDGDVLVCTHYCAAGNQPRMIAAHAEKSDEGTVFAFEFDSVSNLRESHDHYMGTMTLTILENGQLREDWRSFDQAGNLTPPATFQLQRRGG